MSHLTFILCDVYLSLSSLVGKTVCSICMLFLNYYLNDAAYFFKVAFYIIPGRCLIFIL